MKKPEYVGYAACAAIASYVAAPVLMWCTTTALISYGCSWVAVAAKMCVLVQNRRRQRVTCNTICGLLTIGKEKGENHYDQ